jgi:hypothetical protein
MLYFKVSEISENAVGPVVHMIEANVSAAKVELYLPKGYAVPALGAYLLLAAADPAVVDRFAAVVEGRVIRKSDQLVQAELAMASAADSEPQAPSAADSPEAA